MSNYRILFFKIYSHYKFEALNIEVMEKQVFSLLTPHLLPPHQIDVIKENRWIIDYWVLKKKLCLNPQLPFALYDCK